MYHFPCSSTPPDSQIGPELSGISLGILGRYQYLVKPHKSHTSGASAFEFGDAADKGPGTRFCLRVPAPPPPIFWSETFISVDIKLLGGGVRGLVPYTRIKQCATLNFPWETDTYSQPGHRKIRCFLNRQPPVFLLRRPLEHIPHCFSFEWAVIKGIDLEMGGDKMTVRILSPLRTPIHFDSGNI